MLQTNVYIWHFEKKNHLKSILHFRIKKNLAKDKHVFCYIIAKFHKKKGLPSNHIFVKCKQNMKFAC